MAMPIFDITGSGLGKSRIALIARVERALNPVRALPAFSHALPSFSAHYRSVLQRRQSGFTRAPTIRAADTGRHLQRRTRLSSALLSNARDTIDYRLEQEDGLTFTAITAHPESPYCHFSNHCVIAPCRSNCRGHERPRTRGPLPPPTRTTRVSEVSEIGFERRIYRHSSGGDTYESPLFFQTPEASNALTAYDRGKYFMILTLKPFRCHPCRYGRVPIEYRVAESFATHLDEDRADPAKRTAPH